MSRNPFKTRSFENSKFEGLFQPISTDQGLLQQSVATRLKHCHFYRSQKYRSTTLASLHRQVAGFQLHKCLDQRQEVLMASKRPKHQLIFTERKGDLVDIQLTKSNYLQLQTIDIVMNVINKIKSKRNKEQASQIPKQEQRPQAQQQNNFHTQTSKNVQAIKTSSQTMSHLKQEEKSHSFGEDKDQVSINEYYTRKDKKRELMNRIQSSDTFNVQNLKSSPYCFNIKKSSTIGDICVFQGEIIHQKNGKEIYRKKIKLSCSFETIPFPQTVSKILLQKVTMLTNDQGIFVAQNLDKIIEKGNLKK